MNLLQAMQKADFWLLFLAMACGMGSGLATVNNISQIGGSLGYTSVETSTLVSLWSIWNFLGRFGAGYISDYFLHWKGLARPIFMSITLATMSIGHVVIASGLPGALYAVGGCLLWLSMVINAYHNFRDIRCSSHGYHIQHHCCCEPNWIVYFVSKSSWVHLRRRSSNR